MVRRGRTTIQKPPRRYSMKAVPTKSHLSRTYARGRKAIFEYWSEVARTEKNIRFRYEVLVVKDELNIARWSASFVRVPPGLQTKLDGIFVISLDDERRRRSLQEWWHQQQD
jgi:hypothetical protein